MRSFLLFLVACGGHAAPSTTLANHADPKGGPQLTGFAQADLVTLEGKKVVAYSVAGGKVAKLGELELLKEEPEGPMGALRGDWADRDHLFLEVGDRQVAMITASGMTLLPVPDEAKFKTPKPKQDDQMVEGGSEDTGLVVSEGSASWVECPWGYPYDGFQCEQWVSEQLWPATKRDVGQAPPTQRMWSWPAANPAGATTKLDSDNDNIACTAGGKTTTIAGKGDPEHVGEAHWMSTTPPRLLVIYGEYGMADLIPERWTLHDGCNATPLASGSTVEPGPDGLWLARGGEEAGGKATLRRGDQVLGQVPDERVLFRPTK